MADVSTPARTGVRTTGDPTPPLTTTFVPPLSCFTSYWYNDEGYNGIGPSGDATECFPSGWRAEPYMFTYSPGWLCPAGWVTVKGETIREDATPTTRATCCPSGYSWTKAATWLELDYCYSSIGGSPTTITMVGEIDGTTITSTESLWAYSMDRWIEASAIVIEDSDMPAMTAPPVIFPTSSQRTSMSTPGPGSGSGLSTGAKVGLGVGVPLVAVLFIGSLVVCVVWRKRREKAVVKHVYDTPYGPNLGNREFVPQYSVYAGQSGFAQKNENNGTQELAGSNTEKERRPQHGLQEMENNYGHNNLPAGHRPQEMPS